MCNIKLNGKFNFPKQIFSFIIVCVILFSSTAVYADNTEKPTLDCESAIAVELNGGTVMYEFNANKKIYPASTTKIITAMIILENRNLDEIVTVGEEIRQGGITNESSLMGLSVGDVLTVRDLLYGMMMVSGNDAAATLAVSTSGSIEAFSELMNAKAAEYGMLNTHFVTPHGIHNDEHYSTASDMAKLTVEAMKNQVFAKIVGTAEISVTIHDSTGAEKIIELRNTNGLMHELTKDGEPNIFYYPNVTGIKTGYTIYAHGCLVASAKKDDRHVAVLIYGDNSEFTNDRWRYSSKLFNYCFDNFRTHKLSEVVSQPDISIELRHASSKDEYGGVLRCGFLDAEAKTFILPNSFNLNTEIRYDTRFNEGICAPIYEGDVVGESDVYLGDVLIYSGKISATRTVYEEGYVPSRDHIATETEDVFPVDISNIDLSYNEEEYKLSFLWFLIPAGVIIYLIIRIFTVKKSMYNRHLNRSSASKRRRR